MLKAVLTSYQLFMGVDCADTADVSGQLILLARLEDCFASDDVQVFMQTEGEIPKTSATGRLTRTKQVGEMIFGVLHSVFPIGIGIKMPCGKKHMPDLEGKVMKITGELQLHITPEIEELQANPVKIGKMSPCCQTELGDMVVCLEGIEIVG